MCTRVAAHFEVDQGVAQVFDGVAHRQLLRRLQVRLTASEGDINGEDGDYRQGNNTRCMAIMSIVRVCS